MPVVVNLITDTPFNAGAPRIVYLDFLSSVVPSLVSAWYETEQRLIVLFSADVQQTDPDDVADALNLVNWTFARADGVECPRLLHVETVAGNCVRLYLAGPAVRVGEFLSVTASASILSADGSTLVAAPLTALAAGVAPQIRPYTAIARTSGMRDLANDYAGTGSLQATAAGDIRLADAKETLRKLVIRILSTAAGGFAHLPTWGAAVGLKGPARASEIQRVAATAKRQIADLPGVEECSVTTKLNPRGILTMEARVRTAKLGLLSVYWSPLEV